LFISLLNYVILETIVIVYFVLQLFNIWKANTAECKLSTYHTQN